MIYEAHKHKCIMKNGNRTSIRKNVPALVCFHENSLIKLNFCAINQVSLQYQSNPILYGEIFRLGKCCFRATEFRILITPLQLEATEMFFIPVEL